MMEFLAFLFGTIRGAAAAMVWCRTTVVREQTTNRPPIGIIPMYLWEEQRYCELNKAICRLAIAGKPVPQEWINEEEHLFFKITSRVNQPRKPTPPQGKIKYEL